MSLRKELLKSDPARISKIGHAKADVRSEPILQWYEVADINEEKSEQTREMDRGPKSVALAHQVSTDFVPGSQRLVDVVYRPVADLVRHSSARSRDEPP